jgi:hypothetical protein
MKKSKLFLLGIGIIALALAAVGCTTDGSGNGGGGDDPAAAVQLAADINAIEAGKAAVSGDTVTLIGGVRLENAALTVPAGVTLDLTKETLQLAGGAVLTVNGMVNAKADGINIDSPAASAATISGNGTISLASKGHLLGIWEGKKLTLDGVTLTGLKDNDEPLVAIGEGGEFVLSSGAITGNTLIKEGAAGGGVAVRDGGTFTMEGGMISGNTAKGVMAANGGGVFVENGSTFTMTDGTISNNSADCADDGGGGGVSVASSTFTMSGGTISGNSSTTKTGGGGVRVFNPGAAFTMEGGAIFGNTSENGGAVHVRNRSTFTMKGGRIQGGTDSDGFTKNTNAKSDGSSALYVFNRFSTAKWGSGGTYTSGGIFQTDGSDIVKLEQLGNEDWNWGGGTNDTLIAVPAK